MAIHMACQNAGFKPSVVHEVWQLIATLSFVANVMGVVFIVQSAEVLPLAGVKFMRIHDLPDYLEIDILAVWSPKYVQPSLEYFIHTLQSEL